MAASSKVIKVFTDAKEDGEIMVWLYNVPDDLLEHLRAGEGPLNYFMDTTERISAGAVRATLFSSDAYGRILDEIVARGHPIAVVEGYSALDHLGFHR
jgi:hypothetical protein